MWFGYINFIEVILYRFANFKTYLNIYLLDFSQGNYQKFVSEIILSIRNIARGIDTTTAKICIKKHKPKMTFSMLYT